jgi:hypothetical protein
MRLLTRVYKLLTALAKAHQLPKGTATAHFSSAFEALVVSVHKLTPDVHAAVTDAVSDVSVHLCAANNDFSLIALCCCTRHSGSHADS